jgi:hypothetical protein
MKFWGQIGICVLAVGITIAAAAYQGRLTNRWGSSQGTESALALLDSLPEDYGPWHLEERTKLSAEEIKILQCAGHLQGRYVNKDSGETVLVSTLLGPPGPTSVHRPEICFSAVNFPQETDRKRVDLGSGEAPSSAWMVQFRDTKNIAGGVVRAYYAWSDGGTWQAADEPRITYGGRPFLYKVQVVAQLPESAAAETNDAAKSFLSEFMPRFEQLAAEHQVAEKHP